MDFGWKEPCQSHFRIRGFPGNLLMGERAPRPFFPGCGDVFDDDDPAFWPEGLLQFGHILKPDFLAAYFGRGQAYIEKGEEEKATEVFQKAVTAIPDDAKAYFNLGVLYFTNNKDDLALDVLLKARDLDPSMPQVYYQLGLIYTRKGEMDKTIENFEKYLELAPQAPEAETVRKLLEEIRQKKDQS